MSLSPVVRSGVSGVTPLPLFAQFVGVAFGSQNFWLSSKSMFVVPDGFCTRDQNSSRNLPVPAVSVNTPNFFRSLLFGGIAPLTMVGFAVSSFVPWPKLSSPPPLGLSSFASTPGRRLVPIPPASQSMQSAGPSTFRLALTSISKLLPVSVFAVEHAADAVAPPPAMANTAMNVEIPANAPTPSGRLLLNTAHGLLAGQMPNWGHTWPGAACCASSADDLPGLPKRPSHTGGERVKAMWAIFAFSYI